MDFHIIYTKINGMTVSEGHAFEDFNKAEEWLKSIGATYWEIGIKNEDLDPDYIKDLPF